MCLIHTNKKTKEKQKLMMGQNPSMDKICHLIQLLSKFANLQSLKFFLNITNDTIDVLTKETKHNINTIALSNENITKFRILCILELRKHASKRVCWVFVCVFLIFVALIDLQKQNKKYIKNNV